MDKELPCPHCGKLLHADYYAKLTEKTELSVVIKPESGNFIQAGTLGAMLTTTEKLLQATARDLGGHCIAFVTGCSMTPENGIEVRLHLVQALGRRPKRPKNQK